MRSDQSAQKDRFQLTFRNETSLIQNNRFYANRITTAPATYLKKGGSGNKFTS